MIDLDFEKRLRAAAHASVNAVDVPEPPASLRLVRADAVRRRTSGWLWTAAAVAAVVLAVTSDGGRGVVAQASGVLRAAYAHLFVFESSSKPLPPLIHRADRLTIAQAQQHVPFAIVVPAGLPPHTTLQYADVGSEYAVPRVVLNYQTQVGGRYYRTVIVETTSVSGPPVAQFEAIGKGKDGHVHRETWMVPVRRWKHGNVIMQMLSPELPATMTDRIIRENTL